MKTLYVSDLDGTLLRSDETTSDFTNKTINELVSRGMLFSYATARSYVTSRKVTKGIDAKIHQIQPGLIHKLPLFRSFFPFIIGKGHFEVNQAKQKRDIRKI